ncbi:MAG: Nin1 binding protein [Trizodia sp. TS-e1964]|nr:MAG: Nin1 binding protein [Trizodia sp. TS-e1964]
MESSKPIHTLVLDSGPLIKNEPEIDTLRAKCEVLITVPAVLDEIRDAEARQRIQTSLLPFLQLRAPRSASLKLVQEFARKTGDLEVLSTVDLHVLALAYELECERNGGDWRLRSSPGQKGLNGTKPVAATQQLQGEISQDKASGESATAADSSINDTVIDKVSVESFAVVEDLASIHNDNVEEGGAHAEPIDAPEGVDTELQEMHLSEPPELQEHEAPSDEAEASSPENNAEIDAENDEENEAESSESSDSDGWITPSNIKKHQAKEQESLTRSSKKQQKVIQVATLTTDFAMQNVLLRMNLHLLSSSLQRVRHIKTWVLRCHGCFTITKEMARQFCAKCGQPTLMRASCSTRSDGSFTVHLKRNMQWNKRGNVYSIPKPVGGSASGKLNVGGGGKGGGKGGWGQRLILAEDQKEYVRAMREQGRKERNLMDEDSLPGILSGQRVGGGQGRPMVGAGRNVNSRKRY